MPKKRFTSLYSKPATTVHPSLSSATTSSSHRDDATPSVNELIKSLRKSNISTDKSNQANVVIAPSLPPQIQQILSLPQTPQPRARGFRARYDENGRPRPAGPPPPKSWLERTQLSKDKLGDIKRGRLYPDNISHFPGLKDEHHGRVSVDAGHRRPERSLQRMCLRRMAVDWDFIGIYEKNNLADIRTRLRMELLSAIALHGPENGIGFEKLSAILAPPQESGLRDLPDNYGFYRLDVSGSVGRSISFKQLGELVQKPTQVEDADEVSWEDTITRSLSPPLPHLTHLSVSHPPSTVSWAKLLQFAKLVPTLTCLSLAHWPFPSMTPNSRNAVMSSPNRPDVQLGGTGYYSHSLDNDFREAAAIMRRLASILYGLEYLDLSGCTDWAPALRWKGDGEMGVDWASQWVKLTTLKLKSNVKLRSDIDYTDFSRYIEGIRNGIGLQLMMYSGVRRKDGANAAWVNVIHDSHKDYPDLWRGGTEEDMRRRKMLDTFDGEDWKWRPNLPVDSTTGQMLDWDVDVVRRSMWES